MLNADAYLNLSTWCLPCITYVLSLGYEVKMWYISPDPGMIGAWVVQGQKVATHIGLHCGCYGDEMQDHTHFELYYNDVIVDPTEYTSC